MINNQRQQNLTGVHSPAPTKMYNIALHNVKEEMIMLKYK